MTDGATDGTLLEVADRLEELASRSTAGDWRVGGLLASRPEVVAHDDGHTEHVAEARAGSAAWIAAVSPAVAAPLAALLRAAGTAEPPVAAAAGELARVLRDRLP